ncbi:hypothetical protein [Phocaeicola plebeius]|uniref:hypothetical protein n=1 Tax=Phocaeicola plebeius TaxID=310297 RepID=UPI00307E8367
MTLKPILDYNLFKLNFKKEFYSFLDAYPQFKFFLYETLIEGTAYIVGGYLRDIINKKKSRDLDIIFDLPLNRLISILVNSGMKYKINRLGGAKIDLYDFQVDIWCFENNWSFKNKLVKLNEHYIVENIAEGCFYNFDSIVININKLELCSKYYNDCVNKMELDIIQKSDNYKKLNPTIEANILRAIFLHVKYELKYSLNCKDYLQRRLFYLKDLYEDFEYHIINIKRKYKKYDNELSDKVLINNIRILMDGKSQPTLFL